MIALELKEVTKAFGGIKAVDNISLGFEMGKITALIGPNGAGKTTVFNLISGFIRPDSGWIYYKGKDIVELSPWEIANLGIGRLFQDARVFGRMKVLDNIMSAFRDQRGENFFYSLFARWEVEKQESFYKDRALQLLEFVGLLDKKDDVAENLSYGQQKLLSIARLLAADSEVLLLDEPTAGVNPQMVKRILEIIKSLAGEGRTIVVIEHNMNVVIEIADWVYFMNDGQVVSFGLPQDVLGDIEVRKTYIGI